MIGIDANSLNNLIRKTNFSLDSVERDRQRLVNSINELNNCYSGISINDLFSDPIEEINNINAISNCIKNYSNTLDSVKISYQNQDQVFKSQFEHMNSNFK